MEQLLEKTKAHHAVSFPTKPSVPKFGLVDDAMGPSSKSSAEQRLSAEAGGGCQLG